MGPARARIDSSATAVRIPRIQVRRAPPAVYEQLDAIVLEGTRVANGMPRFDAFLGAQEVEAIRAYLLTRRAAFLAAREGQGAERAAEGMRP